MALPNRVKIVEVGPRDGLQNEKTIVPLAVKVELIDRMSDTGLPVIEAGAFVSPKWVPQMADTAKVLAAIRRRPGVGYPVLVPNIKGLEQAIAFGVEEIAIFSAASEAFSARNINCSIAESLERFRAVVETALAQGIRVRGYVSCVLGCPYQGQVPVSEVVGVSKALLDLGCYEISLGDTIGVGTAGAARALVEHLSDVMPIEKLAVHFHDTYGQALANIHACLEAGVAVVDASVAGLGGCPYAKGASGNVATEDVVYLLNGLGIDSGVDLMSLASTGIWISQTLGRPNGSKTGNALAAALPRRPKQTRQVEKR